jgi:tetratricopeptide (TPR) repeat protein
VSTGYLQQFYLDLPEPREDEAPEAWARRLQGGLERFRDQVVARYTEGTLVRLLDHDDGATRRAAVLALGLIGTMNACAGLVGRLRDDERGIRQLAGDALWAIWFRADTAEHNRELVRLRNLDEPRGMLPGLTALIRAAPTFAEAYNQRAIAWFRLQEYARSIEDCQRVLALNPWHFGAQAGMAQCYLKLHKRGEALEAFRAAYQLGEEADG